MSAIAVQPVTSARTGPAGRRQGLRLALILVAAFMVVLDFSIVNVALPSIGRELHATAATVQWVITGYAITFGGLLILGGRAADLFGRRTMFVTGLLVFTAASLAGGLARDPALLIASRLLQGAGAALVAPAALSLITTSFAEGQQRNRALGLYGATASIGFVAGQVLGGVLVEFTSWRAVFLVNVPVGLLAALAAPRLLADSRDANTARKLDARGAVLITASMAALVYAVSRAGLAGLFSPLTLAALAVFAVSGLVFVAAERRHSDPLLPAALVRRPALRTAGTLNVLLGLWNGGEMLVLSLYFQQVLHDSPLATGLAIAPQGVIGFTAGAFGARLASRIGVRRVLVLTGAIGAAGFAILTQLPATGHYSPVLAAVMLVGFGTAGTAFGTMVIATSGVDGAEQGVVGGVINTSRQIGAATGAAVLPAISAAVSHNAGVATAAGTRAAMLAGTIAALLATIIAWRSGRSGARGGPRSSGRPAGAAAPVAGKTASAGWRDHPPERSARPGPVAGLPGRLVLAARHQPGGHRRKGCDRSHPGARRPGRDALRSGAGRPTRRF